MLSYEQMKAKYGGNNLEGTDPLETRLATPEDFEEVERAVRSETGRTVAKLAKEAETGGAEEEGLDESEETFREKFDKFEVVPFRLHTKSPEGRAKENEERLERKFAVALATGDATKLANNGDYDLKNEDFKEIYDVLTDATPEQVKEAGDVVLREIATPVQKKGPEKVLEEISLEGDDEVLARLYNMTLDWKEKYLEDREYSEEEQKQAGIDTIKELVEVDPTAQDFIDHMEEFIKRLEETANEETPDDDAAYEEKMAEIDEWRRSADRLGELIYGSQYRYAKAFERIKAAAKRQSRLKGFEGEPWPPVKTSEPEEIQGETDEEVLADETELPVEDETSGETEKPELYKGLKMLDSRSENPDTLTADELHIKHTLEAVTLTPGVPNEKVGRILEALELEPEYFYAAERGFDTFYDFSRPFLVGEGEEQRRALILYEPYSLSIGSPGREFNKVFYDPIVLIEAEGGVEAVTEAFRKKDDSIGLKTRELRPELKLGEIARSIFDGVEAIDIQADGRKTTPESIVAILYQRSRQKPGLNNQHKVIK